MPERSAKLLVLSPVCQTDRILMYTSILEELRGAGIEIRVWSHAASEEGFSPSVCRDADVFTPYRLRRGAMRRPLEVLGHLNAYSWDHEPHSRTRLSYWQLKRSKLYGFAHRRGHDLGWLMHRAGLNRGFERLLRQWTIRYGPSQDATLALQEEQPSALLAMYPFPPDQLGLVAAAAQLGVPVLAFITSWDNVSTKGRLLLPFDSILAWSSHMRRELELFYPGLPSGTVDVVGAPHYDFFTNGEFDRSRPEFLGDMGLDPARPVVVYALGSPDIIREDPGALEFIRRSRSSSALRDCQIIVRLHPAFSPERYPAIEQLSREFPDVSIQAEDSESNWSRTPKKEHQRINEWVNTMRHADVVVNLCSTIAIDAALCDTPVINLDFDPEPGQPNQRLVKAINREWNHFKPIAESGGLTLVRDHDELQDAVQTYLERPELHQRGRRRIVEHVGESASGGNGSRFAASVLATMEARALI